ncbi:MAG: efflux RND transporter periplasmic adaptor subunit [Pseudomonadota bacterium]
MTPPARTADDPVVNQSSRDLAGNTDASAAPARAARPRLIGWGGGGVLALGLLFLTGYWQKQQETARLTADTASAGHALRRVVTVKPLLGKSKRTLRLPASLEGLEQTEVDARANGYVRSWLVDLGDSVVEGQLLAELDTPELDHELEQARARLAQSEAAIAEASATHEFSQAVLARYRELTPQGIASQQELEQKLSQSNVDEAHLTVVRADRNSQLANLHRLQQLKLFARVVAPFAGTITERGVVRGKLVAAGTGQHLFKIAVLDPVRAFVQVPQSLVAGLKQGLPAQVRVAQQRGAVWEGSVAHLASALDPSSRTMSVEVRVPNADHQLLPGMYGEVTLDLDSKQPTLMLPGSAVAATKDGTRVAIVGQGGNVHWVNIRIERDSGAEVEISEGLSVSDVVIASPGPDISEGMAVRVVL